MNNNSQDGKVDTKQDAQQAPKQQPAAPQKDARTEAPNSNAPKSNVPAYGDKPEQTPVINNSDKNGNTKDQQDMDQKPAQTAAAK